MTEERINTGYAALQTDSDDVPVQVSGVALGDGDITHGGSGKRTLWPGETLRDAPLRGSDEALEGQPIATDTDHTADGPQAQTPSEAVRGEIDWAGYKEGVGVLYEGEVDDPNIARSVENGRLEVSPLVSREVEALEGEVAEKYENLGYDVDAADYVATEITKWRDIATVVNGASPSNEITVGGSPMKAEALHATVEALASLDDLTDDTLVRWNSSGERDAYGMVVDTITEGEYDDEISGDVTVGAPAALIEVHTPGTDGWNATDTMVAHKPDTLSTIEELPNPESLASDMTPPQDVQDHAQDVLDWRDDDEKSVQGMTDTGWSRAEQLASGEELSTDDVQEISAWFARHGAEEYDLNEEGMNPWQDNGRVAIKGWGGPPMRSWIMDKREELVEAGELEALSAEALKEVAGVEFDGTAKGELDESELPSEGYENHYLYPADTKSESSYPVVDSDGNLRMGNVDAAHQLGCRGACDSEERHNERLMALAAEFENPPEWASEEESMAADPAESGRDTQSDDGPNGGGAQSSVAATDSDTTMTDELSDDEKAILEAAEGVDEPAEALNEYAATEGPAIVAQDEYEAMQDNIESVRGVMEEALCERTDLKESTVEALGFEALRAEFETDEGDLDAEALVQNPETGDPETPEDGGVEALGEDADVEKAEALMADYKTFGTEALEQDITAALGVEDFETAKEVLD